MRHYRQRLMKLTPLDIQQQQFRTTLWGFDSKEVDAFLDLVSTTFEDLLRDNNALRDELQRKEETLEEHRARERTLKETMITATRIAEDIKQGARKESEIVISHAELQAEQIIQNAHMRLVRIMDDINELKRQKTQFVGGLESIIATHQKLLEAMAEQQPVPELDSVVPQRVSSKKARPVLATVSGQSEAPAAEPEDDDDEISMADSS